MPDDDLKASRAPGERIGNYVIVRLLGRGGLSEVYLGRNVVAERRVVAIKVLARRFQGRPDLRKRLAREAEIYDALDHPNIVRAHDIGLLDDGAVYIVMDFIRGRTLREHLALGPIDLHGALHIMIQVTSAMCFAHRKDVIHRDLKPENVMVTPNAEVKVLDFGIAKFAQGGEDSHEMPKLGTIAFLAPEQIAKRPVDGRADIYALGLIFYIVLSGGRHPFENDDDETSDAEMIGRHLHAQPRPLHEFVETCPTSAWLIVAKCLAKDPDDRYSTMDDLLEDLTALIHESVPPEDPIAQRAIEEQEIKRASGVQFIAGRGEASAQRVTEPLVNYTPPARVLPFDGREPPVPPARGKGYTQPMPVASHDTTAVTSPGRMAVLPEVAGAPGRVAVVPSTPPTMAAPQVAQVPRAISLGAPGPAAPELAPPLVPGAAASLQPAFSPASTDLTPSSSEAERPATRRPRKRSSPMPQPPVTLQAAPASNASIVLMGLATGLIVAVMVASIPGFRDAVRAGAQRTQAAAPEAAAPERVASAETPVPAQLPSSNPVAGAPSAAASSTTAEAASASARATEEPAPAATPVPSSEPSSRASADEASPLPSAAPAASAARGQATVHPPAPPTSMPTTRMPAQPVRVQAPAQTHMHATPPPPAPPAPAPAPHRMFGSEG